MSSPDLSDTEADVLRAVQSEATADLYDLARAVGAGPRAVQGPVRPRPGGGRGPSGGATPCSALPNTTSCTHRGATCAAQARAISGFAPIR